MLSPTGQAQGRSLRSVLGLVVLLSAAAAHPDGFAAVYTLLQSHCGACHVRGGADGPWSLDTPPGAERYPICLTLNLEEQLRCATYQQLVVSPAVDIPAWIRPLEATASEPYQQACVPEGSFHLGHSLPAALPEADCNLLLAWIEEGAQY